MPNHPAQTDGGVCAFRGPESKGAGNDTYSPKARPELRDAITGYSPPTTLTARKLPTQPG